MSARTWVILGATSIIAEEFAHLAACEGHSLVLTGRQQPQLAIIAADISLRYQVPCEVILVDFSKDLQPLMQHLAREEECDLFIAHSAMINNDELSNASIAELIEVNITSTVQLIHAYWHKKQSAHRLIFISSVAACTGRAKNSLYGASKAGVEIYLQGLQQAATNNQHITIARLGTIDTHTTYGKPGIVFASPPKACAKACWRASKERKRSIYHPSVWRFIMGVITHMPFFIYKKMQRL